MGGGDFFSDYPTWIKSTRKKSSVTTNKNYHGIVDMGSNGIRFSITDLTDQTARILPTKYMYRNGTSLYEAQYDEDGNQIPIPEDVMESVIAAFLRFEVYCQDFGVPFTNIRIIATEATRKAINGDDFIARVAKQTALTVEVLSQQDEGETGAWGIASSANQVKGLVMDLGGGSTQITWMMTQNGHMKTSDSGAFSFPYGAAALTQRLQTIEKKSKTPEEAESKRKALREEMRNNFLLAYRDLEVPDALVNSAEKEGGFSLYLSGGGFRGWGYLLLYNAQKSKGIGASYPISIINGFVARKQDFADTTALKKIARQADRIFRVSDRRRAQVPAVAFLVSILAETIPHGIRQAYFCQGGVREGILFKTLKPDIRMQSPIQVASSPYARPVSKQIAQMLHDALPPVNEDFPSGYRTSSGNGWADEPSEKVMRMIPRSVTHNHIINAFANVLYVHADMSKELASTAALYTTSSGVLANTHGTSHTVRAIIGLMLEARYDGDLPPRDYQFREALRRLISPVEVWWIEYIGAVAMVLSRIYPAGSSDDVAALESDYSEFDHPIDRGCSGNTTVTKNWKPDRSIPKPPDHKKPQLKLYAEFANDLGKSGVKHGLRLTFEVKLNKSDPDDSMEVKETLQDISKKIRKIGKKKNWIRPAPEDDDSDSEDDVVKIKNKEEDDGQNPDEEKPGWGMKVEVVVNVR